MRLALAATIVSGDLAATLFSADTASGAATVTPLPLHPTATISAVTLRWPTTTATMSATKSTATVSPTATTAPPPIAAAIGGVQRAQFSGGALVVTGVRKTMAALAIPGLALTVHEREQAVAVRTTALDVGEYQATATRTYGQGGVTHSITPRAITAAQIARAFPTGQQAATIPPTSVAAGTGVGDSPVSTDPPGTQPVAATLATPRFGIAGGVGDGLSLALVGGMFLCAGGARGRKS